MRTAYARIHRPSELHVVTSRMVCHIITGLGTGGAEMMLWKLISSMDGKDWSGRVLSLGSQGTIGPRIAALGIPVDALGLGEGRIAAIAKAPRRLRSFVRDARPDLVQGWMYHGNLAASLAAGRSKPVIWNVRQSFGGYDKEKPLTATLIRLGARTSRWATRIVYNSRAAAAQHESIGYDRNRTVIIPNGFDTGHFIPSLAARHTLRLKLGALPNATIVGQVARYHPIKNQAGFLKAAAILVRDRPGIAFVLAGEGVDERNAPLVEMVATLGLTGRVHLLGRVEETSALMAGLDVLCSPSWGEGFPNVLGEAMSCGVPCVATDVGDAEWVLGDTGVLAHTPTDVALAAAIGQIVDLSPNERLTMGNRARARIIQEFALPSIAKAYEDLYAAVIAERGEIAS